MLLSNLNEYGPAQKDGTAFVMTNREANLMLEAAGGDARELEKALGLPEGFLNSDELVRVDIPAPRDLGLRIPSGKEAGANEFWIPGGLPTGRLEGVIDLGKALPTQYSVTHLE